MIFVDTSIWVDFFRGQSKVVLALSELLDNQQVALATPVWLEILNGAKKAEFTKLARVLSAIPRFTPNQDSWDLCEKWIEIAIGRGKRFAIPDLLIAAVAAQQKSAIWTLDKDFTQMQALGFVKLSQPKLT